VLLLKNCGNETYEVVGRTNGNGMVGVYSIVVQTALEPRDVPVPEHHHDAGHSSPDRQTCTIHHQCESIENSLECLFIVSFSQPKHHRGIGYFGVL
jgi:hypothetical protein